MSVWDAISTKRAVRDFADRPLASDHLDRILQAGRRSGSSKNLQRWEFIVCRDRDHLRELAAVGPWAAHLAGAAVGIGSVPATVYDHDQARRLLGYPETHHCEYLLSFGYPADETVLHARNKAGGRRPLTQIVHEERW